MMQIFIFIISTFIYITQDSPYLATIMLRAIKSYYEYDNQC